VKPEPEDSVEAQLMRRIARRDSEALSQLYDRLGKWVFSLAMSVVRNRSDAEEVTQEIFLRIWRQASRFKSDRGTVRAWLAIITRRSAIDRTRSRGHKEKKRATSMDDAAMEMTDTGAAGRIVDGAERRIVHDAMGRLEDGQSEVIQLSYYEGYSHSEIADKLQLPLGTVKTRIRNGLKQLRQMLDSKE
jgi:RNA polymerase sigma-70 factor (ECF subfamily)